MEYKGYIGKAEFDSEAHIFHGEVLLKKDVVTFQAQTKDDLEKAFQDSVDNYLLFCCEQNMAVDNRY